MAAGQEVTPKVTLVARNEGGQTRRITSEGAAEVERMATDGLTNTSIAKALNIARSTLDEIRKRQPEVEEALARGRAALEDELSDILMAHARDGNVVAAIYLTKARCGWREGDLPPGSTVRQTNVNIIIPPALPADQMEVIEHA